MAEKKPITRPIQVFLDTKQLIQAQPTGSHGPNRDFFSGDDEGFRRHKTRIKKRLAEAGSALREHGDPAGFVLVQMREESLGKSYRPLNALFTPRNGFALAGGYGIGQMYFQATPGALDQLTLIIEEKAEITPKVVVTESGAEERRVSVHRSELGAIDDIRLPTPADRLDFSARDAVSWLEQGNVIGGYVVELFRPNIDVAPQAVSKMLEQFRLKLQKVGGVVAVPFAEGRPGIPASSAISVDLRKGEKSAIQLPGALETQLPVDPGNLPVADEPDRSVVRHQVLLELLAGEPLVRRVELPFRVEAAPAAALGSGMKAAVTPPAANDTYPVAAIVDAGVGTVEILEPWRAGTAGVVSPKDRDEEHGTFIAGLLSGAAVLNPNLKDRLETVSCKFYDIALLPRRGRLGSYYQTPDEFFDQLDSEVGKAKADNGVRIFNVSLGSPGTRQGIGYSSFAAQLDRIAKEHDVIFVVAAGNLRGLEARPEWPEDPEAALAMLATRAIADERITAPGEHLYGLTVGALNPPELDGIVPDVPTSFTRRGPGPGGARKPELSHVGGALARGGNSSGLFSVAPDGWSGHQRFRN